MTTVTGPVRIVNGNPDRSKWVFSSELRQSGEDPTATVSPGRYVATPNVAGILTVELDPGPCTIEFYGDRVARVNVPDVPSKGLWALIGAGVLMPPASPDQRIRAAVDAYLAENPVVEGLQPLDDDLTAIAALSSAANRLPYATGPGAWSLTDFSPFGRSVVALADGPALRVLAGLVIGTNVHAYSPITTAMQTAVAAANGTTQRLPLFSDNGTVWTYANTSAFFRGLFALTDAAAGRTALGALAASAVGAANGVAPLDGNSLIPPTYLPSYVDDIIEAATLAGFPAVGETGKIYTALNAGTPADPSKIYRWSGSAYVEISPSPGSTDSVPEGAANLYFTNARADARIAAAAATGTGNLVRANSPAFSGTPTGITKTHVGLPNVDNTADANKPVSAAQAAADLVVANASVPKALVDAKGDLLTGTADNTVGRLAVGTNGQVLTADSSQASGMKWAAAAGGSGGSSGFGTYAGMPAANTVAEGYVYICSDIDSEYRSDGTNWTLTRVGAGLALGGAPDSSWTGVNITGPTTVAADKGSRLLTVAPSVTAYEYKTLPVGNYEATALLEVTPDTVSGRRFTGFMTIANNAGAFLQFGWETTVDNVSGWAPGWNLAVQKWNSPGSYASTAILRQAPYIGSVGRVWLRVVDNGTNRLLQYSINGIDWSTFFAEGRTVFLTATRIGWGGTNPGSVAGLVRLRSWKQSWV